MTRRAPFAHIAPFALALIAVFGAAGHAWAQAGIYTCVDAKGRRLTSDRPIVECLDREQKELTPNGNVKRIAIQVVLRTAGGTNDDTAIGPLVNSGNIGNPRTFQANSPSISAGFGGQAIPQFCESWWEVRYQVRWSDNVLTTGSLLAFADLWNDNCYFIQAP